MQGLPPPEIDSELLVDKQIVSWGNLYKVHIYENGQALLVNTENGTSWIHFNEQMLPITNQSDIRGTFDYTYVGDTFTCKEREEATGESGRLCDLSGAPGGMSLLYDVLTQAAKAAPFDIKNAIEKAKNITGATKGFS